MKKLKKTIPLFACFLASMVFSLSSCVDDNESSSVTNIREAHTEQLKAEAALATAQAQAEIIRATADAALSAAKVKQVEAEAKAAEADVKIKEATAAQIAASTENEKLAAAVQLQIAKSQAKAAEAEARAAEAEAEVAIETAKMALNQVKIQADTELLRLEEQLQIAKKSLEAENGRDPVLAQAIEDYAREIRTVNSKTVEIAKAILDIQEKEALLSSKTKTIEERAKVQVNSYKQNIVYVNKSILDFEKIIANYNTLLSKGGAIDIETEIEKLDKEIANMVYSQSPAEIKKLDDARKAFNVAKDALLHFRTNGIVKNLLWENLLPDSEVIFDNTRNVVYYTLGELNIQLSNQNENLVTVTKNLVKVQAEFDAANVALEPAYKGYKEAEAVTAAASVKCVEANKNRDKVYADPQSTQAQKDVADAACTTADATLAAVTTLQSNAYTKYNDIEIKLDNTQRSISSLARSKQLAESDISILKEDIALYGANLDMPKKIEAELLVAYKAWEKAKIVNDDFTSTLSALKYERSELGSIEYQENTLTLEQINNTIKNNERSIENANAQILEIEKSIAEVTASPATAVGYLKADIAEAKNEQKALELEKANADRAAAKAKAIIDVKITK